MKALKHWKVILAVVLVFAAGAVTGSVATTLHVKHAFERSLKVENWTADAMKHLQKDLTLTPWQQPKIKAILDDTAHQVVESFELAIKESGTNIVASWKRIDGELTPEQRVAHQRKCQEFRDGLKKGLKIDLPPQ
jgi:Spy/CpxP family protein refolding chaperone